MVLASLLSYALSCIQRFFTAKHAVVPRQDGWFRPTSIGAALLFLILSGVDAATAEPRRVLVLHSYGPHFSPWRVIAGRFREELLAQSPYAIDLYEASLQNERLHLSRDDGPFVEYLQALFSGRGVDLVVAMGAPAARFFLRQRPRIFPSSPLLITGADERALEGAALTSNDTNVSVWFDQAKQIDNILQVLPDTTNIAVVTGASPIEKFWLEDLRRAYQPFATRVIFDWLNQLSLEETMQRVAKLPPRSAIYFNHIHVDVRGVPQENDRAIMRLHAVANAPIFSFIDSNLGLGIVGGPLVSTHRLASQSATVAVRILNGESAGNIKTPPVGLEPPVYDWRELRHWNISEALLPPGSLIQFREPTEWERYRWQIITTVAIILLQSALIVYVLSQSHRRQRAEKALAASEERMTSTAALMNVGMWQFDRATDNLWATENCRALLGLAKDIPLSRDVILNSIHPEDRESTISALRRAREDDRLALSDFRVVLPDGQIRWVRSHVRPFRYDRGSRRNLIGIFVDVTEQKAAEAETEAQRREIAHLTRVSALGELSATIAHEISQPLTAIQLNAQAALYLLSQQPPNLAEIHEALTDIVYENSRASEVIQRLRNLLRKSERKGESVSLNEIVDSTVRLLRGELIARRINIELRLAADLPLTSGDPVQLQQVVLNLVMNAMDAMAALPASDRVITLATFKSQSGMVELRVADRGPGIGSAGIVRLFEPFYTTKEHGLGLGLSICSTIVDSHGGRLTLENGDNGGAVASISLPIDERLVAVK
jgi:PAS domain S-box-containing protein